MALLQRDDDRMHMAPVSRVVQNQPTSTDDMSITDELLAEADEPPDERHRAPPRPLSRAPSGFEKTAPPPFQRKESLLTSALHMSEMESRVESRHSSSSAPKRGLSTASISTTSTADLTSDSGLTSAGTRPSTPSPTLPPVQLPGFAPLFDKESFTREPIISRDEPESIGPLQKPTVVVSNETTVEAGLGRKRCITFACGKRATAKLENDNVPKPDEVKATDQPKRPSVLKFVCPARPSTKDDSAQAHVKARRSPTPPPVPRKAMPSPKILPRAHRDSDSTVRNDSPKSVRRAPSTVREQKRSATSDIGRTEATRFHEFASSEEEVDEWTEEQTCHLRPLTVEDTLKNENEWRKLVEEVEEETLEEEEDALDEEGLDDNDDVVLDEDDEDENEGGNEEPADGSSDDDGFKSDNEAGFASEEDSDADSEYNFWAAGKSTAATSIEHIEHMRPATRRSMSGSSISSAGSRRQSSNSDDASKQKGKRRKHRVMPIRPGTPDLPDSTDFVCGTLDEDRPLEEAYISKLTERRAAKQKITPQDIDPTFPASDPEMEEEDEVSDREDAAEESDHQFMHGRMEPHDNESRGRRDTASSKKRSPLPSPKRLRSPPPPSKRGPVNRSPPPRKLFGQSPKHLRSPPRNARLRSPPPTRRTSLTRKPPPNGLPPAALAERPRLTHTASLPRHPTHLAFVVNTDDNDEDNVPSQKDIRARGAIDIVKGLERKRQRRKEKLAQKHCRKSGKEKEKRPLPGKGAERMREVGLELAAYRGSRRPFMPYAPTAEHILSV